MANPEAPSLERSSHLDRSLEAMGNERGRGLVPLWIYNDEEL